MACVHSDWVEPEHCSLCLHLADEVRAKLIKAQAKRQRELEAAEAAEAEALVSTAGIGRDPVDIRADRIMPVREGGQGTHCAVCFGIFDDHRMCAHLRKERFDREADETAAWLDSIADPKARKGQKYVVMSATRRLSLRTGANIPVRVGKQNVPLIAVASYGAREKVGHRLSWAPSTNTTADDLPL